MPLDSTRLEAERRGFEGRRMIREHARVGDPDCVAGTSGRLPAANSFESKVRFTYFIRLGIVMPQNHRYRISAILGHMSFEEAFLRRNEIPIHLTRSDIVSHSRWVYLVEWELSNGAFIKIWEPGDYIDCEELDQYNEKHRLTEDRNTSWALVHFTSVKGKEDDEKGENKQN